MNNKDTDQTARGHRLSCIFVVHIWIKQVFWWWGLFEPRHQKTCLCHKQTTKAQISMRIRAVWSVPLFAVWKVLYIAEISRPYLASVAEQASLSLNWLQTLKRGFLMTWLIYSYILPFEHPNNYPKIWMMCYYQNGMANSIDPDQTAPSTLFAQTCLS